MEAAESAHALAVLTEWDEFASLEYQAIFDRMLKPACLFDGRNILDVKAATAVGFEVYSIGRGRSLGGEWQVR